MSTGLIAAAPFALTLPSREMANFGQPYELSGGRIGVDTLGKPAVDQNELTVRMRISTNAIDRDRMIISQTGIDTEFYVDNPVVLFGHGEQGIHIPVALSEDRSGQCTVWRDGDATWAVAYHNKNDQVSMQIFDAVLNKLLRASSVGVTPKPGGIYHKMIGSEKIPIVDGCWLNEWSYCAVPVNPQALIKSYGRLKREDVLRESELQCERASAILSLNRLDGKPIIEPIRKALMSLLPGKTPYVTGAQSMKKSITRDQLKSMDKISLAKMFKSRDEFDDESKKTIEEESAKAFPAEDGSEEKKPESSEKSAKPDEAVPAAPEKTDESLPDEIEKSGGGSATVDVSGAPSPVSDVGTVDPDGDGAANGSGDAALEKDDLDEVPETAMPSEENQSELPGSVTVRAGYDNLKAVVDVFQKEMAFVELPEYKEKIQGELDKIVESLAIIAEAHDSQYKNAPKIAGSMQDSVDPMASVMKSFLGANKRKVESLSHLVRSLGVISEHIVNGGFDRQRIAKAINEKSEHLRKMLSEAGKAQSEMVPLEKYRAAVADAERYKLKLCQVLDAYERLDSTPETVRRS